MLLRFKDRVVQIIMQRSLRSQAKIQGKVRTCTLSVATITRVESRYVKCALDMNQSCHLLTMAILACGAEVTQCCSHPGAGRSSIQVPHCTAYL